MIFHMFTAIIVNYFFNVNLEKTQKVRTCITKTLNDVQKVKINHVLKVNF